MKMELTARETEIIDFLRLEHKKNRKTEVTIGNHTKQAILTTKNWQDHFVPSKVDIQKEVKVNSSINEKIDLVDFKEKTAYELKYSGKNISHEFYKDLLKIMIYNKSIDPDNIIQKFIFISEEVKILAFEKKPFLIEIKKAIDIKIQLIGI